MANGRPPDDGSSHSSRRLGGSVPKADGLAALGSQMRGGAPPGAIANQKGLTALGDRINASGGKKVRRWRRRGRSRWSRRRKVVTVLSTFVVLILLIVAGGYGYVRYEFGRIQKAPCARCTAVADGAPYNVLVIGSDTRVGETAAEAKEFGNSTDAGGQRSDTIKIIHVDPQTETASVLSIPRDTLVTLSGVPASSGVSNPNKMNAAFAAGPNDSDPNGTGANGLVDTIENTFGIPISHWIVVNFFGLMDAVNALHGVNMDVPVPIRDYGDCNGNGVYENCTGLDIATTGCQTLSGTVALALSRSRHYEYYVDGQWQSDGSGDIGRIERQDLLIEAVVDKAKSTYNPFTAASFISSMTHDVTLDNQLNASTLFALAERYHAFSGSSLKTYVLPTVSGNYAPYSGESVEIVQEPAATTMITQFLGTAPNASTTPPLDQYGNPQSTAVTPTTAVPTTSGSTPSSGSSGTSTSTATTSVPSYDPRPC